MTRLSFSGTPAVHNNRSPNGGPLGVVFHLCFSPRQNRSGSMCYGVRLPVAPINKIKGLAESPLAPFIVLLYWKRLDGLRFRSTHPTGLRVFSWFCAPRGGPEIVLPKGRPQGPAWCSPVPGSKQVSAVARSPSGPAFQPHPGF